VKWSAYAKYKPSGVEWLGDIPEHWQVNRLRYSASINDETLAETTDPTLKMFYVDIGSVDPVLGIVQREALVFEDAPSRARRLVRDGDTIVSTVRTYLRAIAPVVDPDVNTIVSTGFAVVRPRSVQSRYLSYALRESGFVEAIVARSVGVSYPAVNASEVGCLPIPLPPDIEQVAIADFLDGETARIDALVAKKRTLIERLKEKRSALISRTVTRGLPSAAARADGLDPNPKLKPSDVSWLRDVPAHWNVRRLGHISSVVRGASPRPAGDPRYFDGDYVPWITVGEVTKDSAMYLYSTESMLTAEGASLSRMILGGTLVLTNSGATLGVPKILAISGCANDGVVAFEGVSPSANKQFLYFFLASITEDLRDRIKQGSGQPNLNTDIVRSLAAPLPPLTEQQAIVDYLILATAEHDALMAQVEAAIQRLLEYRSALITAAVIGKIDVRGAGDRCGPSRLQPAAATDGVSTWR
jgi:type I restriction enzyme S subunit